MANRFLCGFDEYDATGLAYEWTVENPSKVAVVTALSGNAAQLTGASTGGTSGKLFITPAPEGKASGVVGFRVKFDNVPDVAYGFFALGDTTKEHLVLGWNLDQTLTMYRSASSAQSISITSATALDTGTAVLAANTEYYIEVTFTIADSPNGSVAVYLNGSGTPDITASGVDTQNAGTATFTWIGFAEIRNSHVMQIDDVYVNDTTGGVNDTLEGDCQVDYHMPVTPAGEYSQWDRSTGADQWGTVDEAPETTTDYNSTSTLNELDTLNIENFKNTGATIKAVQVNLLTQKSDAGTAGVAPVVRIDSSDDVGDTVYLGTTWRYQKENYDKQPDTTAWNETDFNAMQVGYKKTA
jgi:hypothetical protein